MPWADPSITLGPGVRASTTTAPTYADIDCGEECYYECEQSGMECLWPEVQGNAATYTCENESGVQVELETYIYTEACAE